VEHPVVLALVRGAEVWVAIGCALAIFLLLTTLAGARRLPGVVDLFRFFLRCWSGRLFLLVLWSEAGWHLFTQRP
jgi:hypothetical protein